MSINEHVLIDFAKKSDSISIENISNDTRQRLFQMWSLGMSYHDLLRTYRGTAEEFSFDQLLKVAEVDNWVENRKLMINNRLSDLIAGQQVAQMTRLDALNKVLFWSNEEMFNEMKDYINSGKDPDKRPSWLPNTLKDVEILMNLHNSILKQSDGDLYAFLQNNTQINNYNINGNNENEGDSENDIVEVLKVLADKKTKAFLGNKYIEAEAITNEKTKV